MSHDVSRWTLVPSLVPTLYTLVCPSSFSLGQQHVATGRGPDLLRSASASSVIAFLPPPDTGRSTTRSAGARPRSHGIRCRRRPPTATVPRPLRTAGRSLETYTCRGRPASRDSTARTPLFSDVAKKPQCVHTRRRRATVRALWRKGRPRRNTPVGFLDGVPQGGGANGGPLCLFYLFY